MCSKVHRTKWPLCRNPDLCLVTIPPKIPSMPAAMARAVRVEMSRDEGVVEIVYG